MFPPDFDFEKMYYLSGPMANYPDHNRAAFKYASDTLRMNNVKIISPHQNQWPDEKLNERDLRAFMMRQDLMSLCYSRGIILLPGWPASRGARVELSVAMDFEFPVYFFEPKLDRLVSMNRTPS